MEIRYYEEINAKAGVQINAVYDQEENFLYYQTDLIDENPTLTMDFEPFSFTGSMVAKAGPTLNAYIMYNQIDIAGIENMAGISGTVKANATEENACISGSLSKFIDSNLVWKVGMYESFNLFGDPEVFWEKEICLGDNPTEDPNPVKELSLLWEKRFIGSAGRPVLGPDHNIYVTETGGTLKSLTPDGKIRWSFSGSPYVTTNPFVTEDGVIYVGGTSDLFALDTEGRPLWEQHVDFGWGSVRNITLVDGILYVGVDSHTEGARVYAVHPDGTILWESILTETGVGAISELAFKGDTIYVSANFRLFSLSTDGEIKYQNSELSVRQTPAVGENGMIYIAGPYRIYALDSSLKVIWSKSTGYLFSNSSEVKIAPNGNLYLNGSDKIYVFSPEEGDLIATYVVEYDPSPVSFTSNGDVFVAANSSYSSGNFATLNIWDQNHELKSEYTQQDARFNTIPLVGLDGTIYLGGSKVFVITGY